MKYEATLKMDNNLLLKGVGCLTSLDDLYKVLTDNNTTEIKMQREFVDEYFSYSALCDFIENVAAVAPDIRVYVDDASIGMTSRDVKYLRSLKSPDEFLYVLESKPTYILQMIQSLCDSYLSANEDATASNNKIATLMLQMDECRRLLTSVREDRDAVQAQLNNTNAQLHALVTRINYQYDKMVRPNEMFITKSNAYNKVLYIKEITRVHYTDTLVYYLSEILRTMYGCPTRRVVIESYYSYDKEYLYPDFTPHWKLKFSDVFEGNVLMCGYQPKLMENICHNSSHVTFMIILDRGGYAVPHLQCGNVKTVYAASDLKDVPEDIALEDIISYSEETLSIPYVPGFDELSLEKCIQIYSSMDITKKLIGYLEEA